MQRHSVEVIVQTLNEAGVRYLIAGGIAVVAHGYTRFTADFDILVDLESENLKRVVTALQSISYSPRVPVPFADFIDPDNRKQWIQDKGLTVFSLFSPRHPLTEIDIFVQNPIEFSQAYSS